MDCNYTASQDTLLHLVIACFGLLIMIYYYQAVNHNAIATSFASVDAKHTDRYGVLRSLLSIVAGWKIVPFCEVSYSFIWPPTDLSVLGICRPTRYFVHFIEEFLPALLGNYNDAETL